jgi:dienelactone hydrolase
MPRRLLHCSIGLLIVIVVGWSGGGQATAAPAVALVPAAPPGGTETLGAAWYTVATPEGRTLLVAIYDTRPAPDQQVPAILVLHGTHGFATQYVQIAHDLSEQTGYVVAAGCWFDGVGQEMDTSDITPIRCPGGPEFAGATESAWPAVRALSQAVHQYAGASGLGLFGHSRGAEVALQLASSPDPNGSGVQAVVASSGVYTEIPRTPNYDSPTPLSLAESLSAPVLILHGQADTQARFSNAALYYQRLQSFNKPAQCVVYPRMGHDAILHTAPGDAQHRVFTNGIRRSAAFFRGIFSELSALQALDCVPG